MKKFLSLLFVPIILFFGSCATIFNSKHQNIEVLKEPGQEFLINGEEPVYNAEKGKYQVNRAFESHQIELKREGYKTEYDAHALYGVSPLFWVSYAMLFYPATIDALSPKSGRYMPLWDYSGKELLKWPTKSEANKEIVLDDLTLDVKSEDLTYRSFLNFRKYTKKGDSYTKEMVDEDEDLSLKNTNFENLLNSILVNQGYIDTTQKVLKNSYANNLIVETTIDKVNFDVIGRQYSNFKSGIVTIDMGMEWVVKDYYGEELYTVHTDVSSGKFADGYYDNAPEMAIKDALQKSLIYFINDEGVQKQMNDRSQAEAELNMEEIEIPQAANYVEDLGTSIKSSVTIIRKDDGHGSGFIISEDGYIVTNYHVVSDSQEDLEVVLNNGNRHKGTVIRSSKSADLALIEIDANGLVPFKLSSKEASIAEDIYAVGTPTAQDLGQSVSRGIVSGIRSGDGDTKLIQTDASINGGNSGGALVNKQGEVLGVVQAKVKGFGVEGIAFGIPTDVVIEKLKLKL